MTGSRPTFEEFVEPLDARGQDLAATPLGELDAGDFALLAWIDDAAARWRFGADVEALITARWDTATPRDVHAWVVP